MTQLIAYLKTSQVLKDKNHELKPIIFSGYEEGFFFVRLKNQIIRFTDSQELLAMGYELSTKPRDKEGLFLKRR